MGQYAPQRQRRAIGNPNAYAGICPICEKRVPEKGGYAERISDKWVTFHHPCRPLEAPKPSVRRKVKDSLPQTDDINGLGLLRRSPVHLAAADTLHFLREHGVDVARLNAVEAERQAERIRQREEGATNPPTQEQLDTLACLYEVTGVSWPRDPVSGHEADDWIERLEALEQPSSDGQSAA